VGFEKFMHFFQCRASGMSVVAVFVHDSCDGTFFCIQGEATPVAVGYKLFKLVF
jgi:hypothetical protein